MTFDLHLDEKDKQGEYTSWINRILFVSNTLEISYSEIWQLPEQEFLLLERIAQEIKENTKQKQEQLKETFGG